MTDTAFETEEPDTGELSLDEFLDHSQYDNEGGFLANWKEAGVVKVWLHPGAGIRPLWNHGWPHVVETTDKKSKKKQTVVRTMRWVSMEREQTNKKARHRDKKTGHLKMPPQRDPIAKLVDWVYHQIQEGTINWVDRVFLFESDEEDLEIHAGGMCGLFQKKEMSEREKEELLEAGIYVREAYKENMQVKMQYVFRVVQDAAPTEGTKIAVESATIGDKLKKAIRGVKEDKGDEAGSPTLHPYPFKWTFDKDKDKAFNEMYEVVPLPSQTPGAKVKEAFDQAPPEIDKITGQGNVAVLRQQMEAHWTHVVLPPWDELFAAAMAVVKGTPNAELPTDFNPENFAQDEEGNNEVYGCDACGEEMTLQNFADGKCPSCKTTYEVVNDAYVMKDRPCGNCGAPVDIKEWRGADPDKLPPVKCAKCGAAHNGSWECQKPAATTTSPKPPARQVRREAKPTS